MIEQNWNSFMKTGSISDYLSYIQQRNPNQEKKEENKSTGENPYAGIRNSNRVSTENANHSGVR